VLYSYTYNDQNDVFERTPLVAQIRDLTANRKLICGCLLQQATYVAMFLMHTNAHMYICINMLNMMYLFTAVADFVLIGIHVRPSDAEAELDGLVKVYDEVVEKFSTFNVFLLGDMNADCSYVPDGVYDQLNFTTDSRFLWLIDKLQDTTVSGTHCAYDR